MLRLVCKLAPFKKGQSKLSSQEESLHILMSNILRYGPVWQPVFDIIVDRIALPDPTWISSCNVEKNICSNKYV